MDAARELKDLMLKSLASSEHDNPKETILCLGEDSSLRAQIALDILSKAIDKTKLVRVERVVSKNGKSYVTHLWVLPSKVQKGDIVTKNKAAYENWKKQTPKYGGAVETGADTSDESGKQETAANKKPTGNAGINPMAKLAALNAKKKAAGAQKKASSEVPKKLPVSANEEKTHPVPDKTQTEKPKNEAPKKPAKTAKKPESDAKAKPNENTYADKKTGQENEPGTGLPEIFTSGVCNEDTVEAVYKQAGLKKSDTLASQASFEAAVNSLQYIKKTSPAHVAASASKVLQAMIVQHNEALYGKAELQKAAEKYKGTEAAKYYIPELIASAANAWTHGDSAAIRNQSVTHKEDDDPVNTLYSKCLTDMIRHNGTVQKETLYRGIHVNSGFLREALEKGTFDTAGLVSTSTNESTAKQYALKTDKDEISVILELPPALKMKTLELEAEESLLSTHGKFGVKSVTKDADGIYHVQLKTKGVAPTKPIADEAVYNELNAQIPAQAKQMDPSAEMTEALYSAIVEKYYPGTHGKPGGVVDAMSEVYTTYGYDKTVRFLEIWADKLYAPDTYGYWHGKLSGVDCGYSTSLLVAARMQWVEQSASIRAMEEKELTEESTGYEIRDKIYNDAFNAFLTHSDASQPSMLYRGMHGALKEIRNMQPGDEFSLGGMASFSTKSSVAEHFAYYGGVILKIPKAMQVNTFYVEGLNEAEWIVQDQPYKVVERKMKNDRLYITLGYMTEKDKQNAKAQQKPEK